MPQSHFKPLKGGALAMLTLVLSLATFMLVLDSTIANVAIPTIAGDLGASSSQGTWVITSFGVANAISIPITGWLAKRFGEVRLFLVSTLLFVLASWLCGISHSLEMLIVFRVLQGAVAGPIIPLSQSLLLNNYPPEKRGMALAFWSMTIVVAPICGPILGGWISDNIHWGWIFFINVPIGLAVVLISWKLLEGRESRISHQPVNTVGLILLALGVGALQLMLDQGRELDWFNSTEIVVLTIIAAVGLIALIIWELTDDNPVVDVSLFKSRNFTVGCVSTSLAFLVYSGTVVLIPLLLQQVYNYTATWAGLAAAPVGLLPILLAPIIGKFGNKIDMRILITISFMVYALTFYWRAVTFEPEMTFMDVALPQFVQGLAVACFFMPLTTITLSGLPPEKMASASSLFNFLRTLAGSIGTSLTTFIWYNREAVHHTQLTEVINPYNPISQQFFQTMGSFGLSEEQTASYIARQITAQGFIIGANEIFLVSAITFISLVVLIWFAKPPFSSKH
ncbi:MULTISPECIES: DHA2 family efflux MFS transporter permease subunit [Haemophilus]|jgi:multidrug resistance protein B homolog|uniref:DHA2 family efflux MFS transporter permease subunit n=1 Tax=Haemophilus TaxID=724 RepID=UPI00025B24E8|nr:MULTISPECIES: DHA2 family efflux MFS transporter permease subunit [Haemophilus]EIF36561.1 multidrug resistance protein B [Haemophilus parainfluenzae HK262]MBS7202906.1 MFS transporter [Haemophilus parainfluenzae]MDU1944711.1 DHA2 family efflux MFS transporter permease subunit [Haemophilus parainfluenzae]MDU2038374.1 DHA2 family efflux MFS transporter permease subunit [Haemophilus parainfluenzae]MDU6288455.1 DHA2 family efflux MFS transporter permease subunit [Haemophilus parainfluenzae]